MQQKCDLSESRQLRASVYFIIAVSDMLLLYDCALPYEQSDSLLKLTKLHPVGLPPLSPLITL